MLKWLAILWLVLSVGGAWSQVPRDGSAQNQESQSGQNSSKPSNPVTAGGNAQVSPAEEKKSADPKPPNYPWKELLVPANIPTWFLVLIGACGVLAAVRTLGIISRQTSLMKEQLDRMVEKERARLSLTPQQFSVCEPSTDYACLQCTIEATNTGHSNAYIRFGAAHLYVDESGERPLPNPDPEHYFPDVITPGSEPAYIGSFLFEGKVSLDAFANQIANSVAEIYLYGFIEYETLGIRWHRDFGWRWEPPEDGSGVFRHNGKEYFGGGWEPDTRQKNSEYQIKAN